jgi:hypothetical protein
MHLLEMRLVFLCIKNLLIVGALLIFSGCYGNRDHRPGSSVHRESAQMADDDDVTNCLYSPLFKYPFRGHTVTCRITLPMNSNTDNTLSAAGCVMN